MLTLKRQGKHLLVKVVFLLERSTGGSSINTFFCNLMPFGALNTCQSLFIPHPLNTATFKAASHEPQVVSEHRIAECVGVCSEGIQYVLLKSCQ